MPSPGMLLSRTPNGTSYRPQPTPVGGSSATASPTPWQPYLSTWTGTGPDPHPTDRAQRFRLYDGQINSRTPTNMTDELVAFGDPTDTEIEQPDAVVTCVYLQVPVSESTVGSGDLKVARPTIMAVEGVADDSGQEGADLGSALAAFGATPPVFGDDGSLPAYIVIGLYAVYWWGGSLHFAPGIANYLFLTLANGGGCDSSTRNFQITSA